jgi:ABC-2 type transport system permease protein
VLAIVALAFPIAVTVLTAIFTSEPLTGSDLAGLVAGLAIVSAMLLAVVSSLGITSEFSHGTIRPTFAAMPDRLRPLLAKPIVQVALAAALTVSIVVIGWLAGAAIGDGDQQLGDDGAVSAMFGVVLLAIGLALLGYGLGLLIRNSAATVCILLLWPLIVEGLIAGLLTAAGAEGLVRFLPYSAGFQMAVIESDPDSFGGLAGGLYFFAWVAVILVLGVVTARRRDA